MSCGERFLPADPTDFAPKVDGIGPQVYPADDTDHVVKMVLHLAPWIDQSEDDPLWMPGFLRRWEICPGYSRIARDTPRYGWGEQERR